MSAVLPLSRHFADLSDPLGHAFSERTLFPWVQRQNPPLPEPAAAYARLMAAPRPGKRVAYIHVPFCTNHCLFCGFYRNRSAEEALRDYAAHVVREIAADLTTAVGPIHAVYFGGGTPSALTAEDLHRLIRAVRDRLPLAPDCEITVEGRVVGFDDDKIDACLGAGANRFSIGVQTFDTDLRQRMGRKATREETIAFLSALRDRDCAAIVCDLIFGLPGQNMASWRRDVRTCTELGLDGIDLYCLTLHDKGPLAQSIRKGILPPMAALDEMARMYAAGLKIMKDAGWRHINQAHWASNTRERNLYNQLIKAGADCLAFGSGAGGLLDGHRYVIDPNRESYQRRVDDGEKPITTMLSPPAHRRARDLVMSGLEGGRLDLVRLESLTAPGFADALSPLLDQWAEAGLLRRRGSIVVLTVAGWFWYSNLVGSLFDMITAYLNQDTFVHHPSTTIRRGDAHAR